jgi:hypothetical protein
MTGSRGGPGGRGSLLDFLLLAIYQPRRIIARSGITAFEDNSILNVVLSKID